MKDKEVEIKIEITEKIYKQILEIYGDKTVEIKEQDNHFMDTPGMDLQKKLWVMRLRFIGEEAEMTVKGPRTRKEGIHIRPEFEEKISPLEAKKLLNGFNLKDVNKEPAQKLLAITGDLPLSILFSFQNHRTVLKVWEEALWELDKTRVKDETFYELEIECSMDKADELNERIKNLFESKGWPLNYNESNKFVKAKQIYGK